MKRAVLCLALGVGAGCGDNIPAVHVDAAVDAPEVIVDAAIDAPLSRPGTRFTGSIGFVEVAVLNSDETLFGQGLQANITFFDNHMLPPPLLEEDAGPLGCKVYRYNRAESARAVVGIDQGQIDIDLHNPAPVHLPTCVYEADNGYRCIETASAGTTGTMIATGSADRVTLTDANATFSTDSVGRHVRISGATHAANNGTFPIVDQPEGAAGDHAIVFVNPEFVAESTEVTHATLAAYGAFPRIPDPGELGDDVNVDVTHTMNATGTILGFTAISAPSTVADDFDLTDASDLTAVPGDGSAYSVSCDATNCPSGSATLTRLDLLTTDASLIDQPELSLPPPADHQVHVRCTAEATGAGATITVPSTYMQYIASSGATRIQATFTRATALKDNQTNGDVADVEIFAGHALVGYTD